MRESDAAELLTELAPRLLSYFRRRVADREDAADLVGETIAAAWRSARRMPSESEQARMWAFGVARNTLLHHRRSSARRDALTLRLAATFDHSPWADDGIGIDVRAAVDALPADLGELIRLVHWDGFSVTQAAAILGIKGSTARTRHARAKELLRTALQPTESPPIHTRVFT